MRTGTPVDDRPSYLAHGKVFCAHRNPRKDAIDTTTGELLDDVLVFKVADEETKALILADDRRVWFTTPHFDGYAYVLIRIPALALISDAELTDAVVDAWMTRATKTERVAWLEEHGES